jgi:hypothetical protein
MTNNPKFTIMAHDNRHLIIKTSEGGNPHSICECFLLETAEKIRQLLTDAADANLTLENAPKQK